MIGKLNRHVAARVRENFAALQMKVVELLGRRAGNAVTWQSRERRVTPPRPTTKLDFSIDAAQHYLLARQHPIGYWVGELQADSTLESDYIFFMHWLGERDEKKIAKLVRFILDDQNADGGWSIYHRGPSELNPTVKAYVALRLAGFKPDDPPARRAREAAIRLGGIENINSYSRVYMAMLGLMSWEKLPAIIPELMLMPKWSPFNIYEISSWSRGILVPLTIIHTLRPHAPPHDIGVDELRSGLPEVKVRRGFLSSLFRWIDGVMRVYDRMAIPPIRRRAMREATEWMLEHMRPAGGIAGIFPALMNSLICLRALGYSKDAPEFRKTLREFREFEVEDGDVMRMQPCFSPVWDTAWTMIALSESGVAPASPALRGAASWLISKQEPHEGDWTYGNPGAEPGGWYFEFDNVFYPDVDDTVAVLMALHSMHADETAEGREAFRKGLTWMLSMQNDNGGWGAFDRNNDREWLNAVPFADHNALLDPSMSDMTGRIIELLGIVGFKMDDSRIRRAVAFIRRDQRPDGSWYGRWGVNYIYGTWQALRGVKCAGEDMNQPYVQRAVAWLRSIQGADGGWGESCETYVNERAKGRGPSTPSQTAWAILGLVTASPLGVDDPAVRRGIRHLVTTQQPFGGWNEDAHTGTGFPGVFYLKYTMYRHYFPLLALAVCRARGGDFDGESDA